MKKAAVLFFLLLFPNVYAQSLVGRWSINSFIGAAALEVYVLLPTKAQEYEFGTLLMLQPDGSFSCRRVPGCGQDRFPPSSYGQYSIIDDHYIHFFVERVSGEREALVNEDLGNYYYYRQDGGFRFLKSSGSLERDRQVVYYRDLLSGMDSTVKGYDNILDWKPIPNTVKDDKGAVSFCLAEAGIVHFDILYAQPVTRYRQTIFLVQTGAVFRYVFYDQEYQRVALYDDCPIKATDALVLGIDCDKKLKTKIFKASFADDSLITVYLKKKEIYKAVYNRYFVQGGGWFITIYFEHGIPVYVVYEERSAYNGEERSSKLGCYITDVKKNKIITKVLQSERGVLYFPDGDFTHVLEAIKKQLP